MRGGGWGVKGGERGGGGGMGGGGEGVRTVAEDEGMNVFFTEDSVVLLVFGGDEERMLSFCVWLLPSASAEKNSRTFANI